MSPGHHFAPFSNPQRGGIISRLIFLIGFVILLFFLYLIRAPILREYASFFIVDDAPQHSDAIIMLGDDNFKGDRAAHAAELFKAGWAPKVVASGRALRPYAGIAELEAHDLAADGVPENAIIRYSHSASDTHEECVFIGQLVAQKNWKRVIIVTSTYHTRRSRYICERTMPPGTILRMSAARDSDFDPENWWRTRKGLRLLFHESVGMIDSLWEMRHDEVKTRESSLLSILPQPLARLSPH
ncbi:MAG TPA: YdcF family protein [Candidatus Acidoferrales bacterium]|nr:YdcF family protein [Candidatus Acidoferrales bacterium]